MVSMLTRISLLLFFVAFPSIAHSQWQLLSGSDYSIDGGESWIEINKEGFNTVAFA